MVAATRGMGVRRRLAQQIRAAIGVSVKNYYHRKVKWLADVGYEDGHARFIGTMNLGSEDTYEALVDFAIGLRDSVPFVMEDVSDLRFGIPRSIDRSPRGGGLLSIQPLPSAMRATVQFASSDGRAMASFAAEVFSPTTLFPFIPRTGYESGSSTLSWMCCTMAAPRR